MEKVTKGYYVELSDVEIIALDKESFSMTMSSKQSFMVSLDQFDIKEYLDEHKEFVEIGEDTFINANLIVAIIEEDIYMRSGNMYHATEEKIDAILYFKKD